MVRAIGYFFIAVIGLSAFTGNAQDYGREGSPRDRERERNQQGVYEKMNFLNPEDNVKKVRSKKNESPLGIGQVMLRRLKGFTKNADTIAIARVESMEYGTHPLGIPLRIYTLKVEKLLKGSPDSEPLKIAMVGGIAKNGSDHIPEHGDALTIGEKELVFVHPKSAGELRGLLFRLSIVDGELYTKDGYPISIGDKEVKLGTLRKWLPRFTERKIRGSHVRSSIPDSFSALNEDSFEGPPTIEQAIYLSKLKKSIHIRKSRESVKPSKLPHVLRFIQLSK